MGIMVCSYTGLCHNYLKGIYEEFIRMWEVLGYPVKWKTKDTKLFTLYN